MFGWKGEMESEMDSLTRTNQQNRAPAHFPRLSSTPLHARTRRRDATMNTQASICLRTERRCFKSGEVPFPPPRRPQRERPGKTVQNGLPNAPGRAGCGLLRSTWLVRRTESYTRDKGANRWQQHQTEASEHCTAGPVWRATRSQFTPPAAMTTGGLSRPGKSTIQHAVHQS